MKNGEKEKNDETVDQTSREEERTRSNRGEKSVGFRESELFYLSLRRKKDDLNAGVEEAHCIRA